jgi:hypothetical protein
MVLGCWVLLGVVGVFGFVEYDHGSAPGSAAKANLLTGWVLQILLQILLPSSSSSSSGSALRFD